MEVCAGATSINSLMRQENLSEGVVIAVLSDMITRAAAFFNIQHNITPAQSVDTASMLLEKYGYESLEDFSLIFKKAKRGEFGKIYNRLDGQIIFEWCERHFEEKISFREERHKSEKGKDDGVDLMALIQGAPESSRSVLDALKEGIGYDEFRKREEEYARVRTEFLRKRILEKGEEKSD